MDHLDYYALKRDTVERLCTKEIICGTNQFVTDFFNIAIIILGLCGLIEKYNIPFEIMLT